MAYRGGGGAGGFTLLELMIGIALVAMMAVIAVPDIRAWLPDYRLGIAARDFFSICQSARMEAIERSENCAVTFDLSVGGKNFDYVSYVDRDQDLSFDVGDEVLAAISLEDYRDVKIDAASGGATFLPNAEGKPSVAFDPRGNSVHLSGSFGAGSLYLVNRLGKVRRITVNAAGGIRIR